MLKPVLKRSCYHQGTPVIISFKSFEVWLIQQSQVQTKIHNPIYIPLSQTEDLLRMSVKDMEQHVVKSLK